MPKDDAIRLRHMLEFAQEAVQAAKGHRRSDLEEDRVWMLGLVKCIEVVGEAAAHVSEAKRSKLPQLPWAKIVGMRHRLVHVYFDVDLDLVWDTVTLDLPPLIAELEKILAKEPAP
jgi:uncharacterized protein with HEPN domain